MSALVDFLARKHNRHNRYNLQETFIATAGFPGVLDEYIRKNGNNSLDHYAIGLRSLDRDSDAFKLLQRLFEVVKELKSMHSLTTPSNDATCDDDERSVVFTWTSLVSLDHVDASTQPALLYELTDLGYLQYQDGEAVKRIGFFSPRIYLEMLLLTSGDGLTLAQLMALRCPHGVYEKSAEVVTASLLMRAEDLWKEELGVEGLNLRSYTLFLYKLVAYCNLRVQDL
jgi:hypothetical protein